MQKKQSHISLVEEYFDNHTQAWHDLYKPKQANDIVNRKNIAIAFLSKFLESRGKVLDAGCGAGLVAMQMVQQGFFVHGIDISKEMIDRCEKTFTKNGTDKSKYRFTVGGVYDSGISRDSLDGVIGLGFLQYQDDEQEALTCFQEILKPGGILVLSGPIKRKISNLFGLADILSTRARKSQERKAVLAISVNYYSLSRFKRLLNSSGFTLLYYKRKVFNFCLPRQFNKLVYLVGGEGVLRRAFERISSFLPVDRFANDIIIVARKDG
ncbi:MAG: methyltransferase domain-containing protein [Calditrichaeota bacterium]|nr:methyltransferase domain-containing protein [Calditrichota bacterium]